MSSVFIRQMRAEKLKARHKKAILVPLGFLLFQILWAICRFPPWIPRSFRTDI